MKTKLAVYAAIFLGASASSHSEEYSVSVDLKFDSEYIFRGVQLADDAFHPSIEIAQDDFYIGAWAAQPLEGRGSPERWDDELDFYGGYGWAINEKTSFDVGAAYYTFQSADSAFEPYIGIVHEIQGVETSVYLYRDLDRDTTSAEGEARYSLPLGAAWSLDLRTHLGVVDSDDGGNYLYYGADVIVPIELNDRAVFSVGLHYSDNDIGFLVPDNNLHGSTTISIGF